MDDTNIITAYCIIDDVLNKIGHKSHPQAGVSDAEVLLVAVVAAMYFQNHHERTLFVMKLGKYVSKPLSISRFSRRLHALAEWLQYVSEIVGQVFTSGEAYIIDSVPLPVCKRVRAFRCKKLDATSSRGRGYFGYCHAKKEAFFGYRLHLVCDTHRVPVTFVMLPGAWHDLTPVHELTFCLPKGASVYADKGYVSARDRRAIKGQGGVRLVAKHKANMKPNTFQDYYDLREYRPRIETANSQLEKMGFERLYARTPAGFAIKVHASLLALACINLH